jgi:IclR family acetate operon transcriptional repressor
MTKAVSGAADGVSPGTVAVQRALMVLKCFLEGDAELRLSAIARDTGLSVSTTHRLLAVLCDGGFLAQDPDTERYLLGPVLVLLGQRGARAGGLDEAQAALEELTRLTGESATLAVRSGHEAVVVALSPSPQRLRFDHGIGSRIALHASAMGKVLLACTGADLAAEVRALGRLERFTRRTISSKAALTADLRAVRWRGWANNVEERYDGVVGAAAPVLDVCGRAVAAIGVQGPSARLDVGESSDLVAAVRDAARRLDGRLIPSRLRF